MHTLYNMSSEKSSAILNLYVPDKNIFNHYLTCLPNSLTFIFFFWHDIFLAIFSCILGKQVHPRSLSAIHSMQYLHFCYKNMTCPHNSLTFTFFRHDIFLVIFSYILWRRVHPRSLQLNKYETAPYFSQLGKNLTCDCLLISVFSP
jgi:hypothetical protein